MADFLQNTSTALYTTQSTTQIITTQDIFEVETNATLVLSTTNDTEDGNSAISDSTGLGISLAVVDFILVMGNLFTLFVISRFKPKAVPDILVTTLAVSDLLTGLLPVPVAVYAYLSPWDFSQSTSLCNLFGWVSFTTNSGSMFILTLMAVDRYLAICRPFFYKSKVTVKRTVFFCIGGLLASAVLAAVPLLASQNMIPSGTHNAYCHFDYGTTTPTTTAYATTVLLIGYMFMLVVLFCYISAICTLRNFISRRKHMSKRLSEISEEIPELTRSPGFHGNHGSPNSQERCLKLEAMFTRMSWVLLMVYWITWTPLLGVITAAQLGQKISPLVDFVSVRLAVLNSVINPFIILCLYEPYRKGYWYIISRLCSSCQKKKNHTPPSNPWTDRRRLSVAGLTGSRSTPTTPTLHHNNLGTPRRCLSMGDIVSTSRQEPRSVSPPPEMLTRAASCKSILTNGSRRREIRKSFSVQWNERVTIAGERPGKISIDTLKKEPSRPSTSRIKQEKYIPDDGSWSDSDSYCSTCSGSYSDDSYSDDWGADYCDYCDKDDVHYDRRHHDHSQVRSKESSRARRTRSFDNIHHSQDARKRQDYHDDYIGKGDVKHRRANSVTVPEQRSESERQPRRHSEYATNSLPRTRPKDYDSYPSGRKTTETNKETENTKRRGRSKSADNIPVKIETCLYNHAGYRPCFRCRAMYGRRYSGCKHMDEREKKSSRDVPETKDSQQDEESIEQKVVVQDLGGDNPQFYNLVFQHVMGAQKGVTTSSGTAVVRDLRQRSEQSKPMSDRDSLKKKRHDTHTRGIDTGVTMSETSARDTDELSNASDTRIVSEREMSRIESGHARRHTNKTIYQNGNRTGLVNLAYVDESGGKHDRGDESVPQHRRSKSDHVVTTTGRRKDKVSHLWPAVIVYDQNEIPTLHIQKNKIPLALAVDETTISDESIQENENKTENDEISAEMDSKSETNKADEATNAKPEMAVFEQGTQTTPNRCVQDGGVDSGTGDVTPSLYHSSAEASENEIPYSQYVRSIKYNGSEKSSENEEYSRKSVESERKFFPGIDGHHMMSQIRSSTSSGIGSSTECSEDKVSHKRYSSMPAKVKHANGDNSDTGIVNSGYLAESDSDAVTTAAIRTTPSPRKQTKKRRSSRTPEGAKRDEVVCTHCGCHVNDLKQKGSGETCKGKSDSPTYHCVKNKSAAKKQLDLELTEMSERGRDLRRDDYIKETRKKSPLVVYRSEMRIKLQQKAHKLSMDKHMKHQCNNNDNLASQCYTDYADEGAISDYFDGRRGLFGRPEDEGEDEVFISDDFSNGNDFKLLKRFSPKVKTRRHRSRSRSHEREQSSPKSSPTKPSPIRLLQVSTGVSQV